MKYDFYIGTNSVRGSEGIYHVILDGETGRFSMADIIPFYNSGYLIRNAAKDKLYVASEGMTWRGKAAGGVAVYDVSGGKAAYLDSQWTSAQRPCHISLSKDEDQMFAGNFFGGTVDVFPVDASGMLAPVKYTMYHTRTEAFRAGIHCVTPHPNGETLAAIELAHNSVNFYDKAGDYKMADTLELAPGTFPRHLEFSEDGRFLYLLSQEKSVVYVYSYNPTGTNRLTLLQEISTLPEDFTGHDEAAAIRFDPSGKFLMTSNRGVGTNRLDALTIFRQDAESGLLTLVEITPTAGMTPRDAQFTPDGLWVIAAEQASDALESFRFDPETGHLTPAESGFHIPSPACIAN